MDFASFKTPETLQIAHPLLRKWVDGTPVATKLTATLNPEDMRDDVWLCFEDYFQKRDDPFQSAGSLPLCRELGCGRLRCNHAGGVRL